MRCMSCGHHTRRLSGGGCGGVGSVHGCLNCDAVYRQTNGGIVSPPGGVAYARDPHASCRETIYHMAKQIKPRQIDFASSPNHGQWTWEEIGTFEWHYFDTREEAETWLKIYVMQVFNDLPWPDCVRCKQKSEKQFGRIYKCKACNLQCIGSHGTSKVKWFTLDERGCLRDEVTA